jgi:FkbM family methyltransferase
MTRIQARLNGVADRVRVVEAAVGDHAGSQRMIAVGVLADGYFATPTQDCPSSECTEAPATTVDALVAETGFAPTHLKIDVEGAEASVLRGAKQTLNGPDSPLLFVELHNKIVREQGGDPAGTLSLLRECGYAPVGADGSPLGDEAMLQPDIVRVRAVRARS